MKLRDAFHVVRGDVIALTGAGGKTSTLIALAHELADEGWRVLATTTTRIAEDELRLMPRALKPEAGAKAISAALEQHRFTFIYDHVRGGKAYGLDSVAWLLDSVDADALIIEADGARRLPLKAPYPHEPVIPPEASLVVPIASISALGQPLDDEHIYNAAAMIDKFGFYPGGAVKSPWIAQVLRDPDMGLKGVPERARVVAWLNGTPRTGYLRARARLIAKLILKQPRFYGAALGSTRENDPVCEIQRTIGAVVLAAGMARRMGEAKVLLPWTGGRTILEHIIHQLILARVDPIIVVTGSRAADVRAAAERAGAAAAHNPNYETGEMLSSLKAGLKALPAHVAAALVALGDQPRIQPRIVDQLLMAYAEGKGGIIAPSYQMRRGHPILIDRRYWGEILDLPKDGAPRDVISRHAVTHVNVETDSVLRDIDTPDDYRDERGRAGLA
jgi:molybdenum cofactor cytidylyltransferase